MNETSHWCEAPNEVQFAEIENAVDRLYDQSRFQDALVVLETAYPGVPERSLHPLMSDFLLTKAFLLSRLGHLEDAMGVVRAFLRVGHSIPLQWKIFEGLRALDGYDAIAQENANRIAEEQAKARLDVRIRLPEDYDSSQAHPLALLLHGDGQNSDIMERMWDSQPMLERGFIVAFVQSSQLVSTNHFVWLEDPTIAWKDVCSAYDTLCGQHAINPVSLILAGFSGGAITAVDLTFGEALPATGFICLCPELKPAHFTSEAVDRAVERGVRGVFLEGSKVWPLDDERDMLETMHQAKFPVELLINEGIGHAAPADFAAKLGRALDFIAS